MLRARRIFRAPVAAPVFLRKMAKIDGILHPFQTALRILDLEEANAASLEWTRMVPACVPPVILIFDCHALPFPSLGGVSKRKAQRVPVERSGTIPGRRRLLPEIGKRTPKAAARCQNRVGKEHTNEC